METPEERTRAAQIQQLASDSSTAADMRRFGLERWAEKRVRDPTSTAFERAKHTSRSTSGTTLLASVGALGVHSLAMALVIVEDGTHRDLRATRGRYAQMHAEQASGYA